ncbi:unnamed protein product [Lepidochelys kempii]
MTHLICSVSISERVTTVIRSELECVLHCTAGRGAPLPGWRVWAASSSPWHRLFYWKTN